MFSRKLIVPAFLLVGFACMARAQKPESPPKADNQATSQKSDGDAKNPNSLESFMRKKLDASSLILEGLCQEDADLIKKGADQLSEMSKIERWNVLTDATYREQSREFRDNAARVAEAAAKGDFDKAALRWFDVTMSCLECHNHVRGERKSDKKETK